MHLLVLSWLLQTCFDLPPAEPPKIALVVTVSRYCDDCRWGDLHADADAVLLKDALLRQGFLPENIFLLQDADATRAGILRALEEHLLGKAKKGGLAVFHFSGHGQQVWDDNGDELDGFDEAIVPYDSPLYYQKGVYEGENLIRDEELGSMLEKVRKKLGKRGHLLALLDSCHSGTGLRGMGSARGTDVIMAENSLQPAELIVDANPFLEEEGRSGGQASQVAFFGSGAQQLNHEIQTPEGEWAGSLTYAFCQALTDRGSGESYQVLFDRVRLLMGKWTPRQQPQAEGSLQLEVFGGQVLEPKNYYRLAADAFQNRSTLTLEAGRLQGLFPGTQLGFYSPNSYDWQRQVPLAYGRISTADLLQSRIELDRPVDPAVLIDSWIYIVERHYGNLRLSVELRLPDGPLKRALLRETAEFPVIDHSGRGAGLLIQTDASGQFLQAQTPDGSIVFETALAGRSEELLAGQLARSLLQYLQSQFLRTLQMEDPSMAVEATLLPEITEGRPERGICRVGDLYRLEFTNRGQSPAYYTLIDIQPDHQMKVLIPAPGSDRTLEEYYLRPGETKVFEIPFKVAPPLGLEVLKVIATEQPVDLRTIADTRGQSEEYSHPLEKLFAATCRLDTRGEETLFLFPELNIQTVVFEIVE